LTVKEYLSQAFVLNKLVKAKKARIQHLSDMRESIAGGIQNGVKVKTGTKLDPMGEVIAEILDTEEECHRDIIRLLSIQREIETTIEAVAHADHRLILYERYVNLKNWEVIAEDNNYSLKWVYVLHKRGLDAIERSGCESLLQYAVLR